MCVWSECVVSVMAHTTSATGFPAEWHPNIACGNLYFYIKLKKVIHNGCEWFSVSQIGLSVVFEKILCDDCNGSFVRGNNDRFSQFIVHTNLYSSFWSFLVFLGLRFCHVFAFWFLCVWFSGGVAILVCLSCPSVV